MSIVKKYRRKNSFILKTLFELYLNLYVSLKLSLSKGIKVVVAFGSVNAALPGLLNLNNCRIVFWGVDYSVNRFESAALNKCYRMLETIACKFSDYVISPNRKQADIRITSHHLKKEKAIVASNGVVPVDKVKNWTEGSDVGLLYIGSLSAYHGLVNFIVDAKDCLAGVTTYIIGNGPQKDEIVAVIKKLRLKNVILLGTMQPEKIEEFISNSQINLVGIAPYSNTGGVGHLEYLDSLKIKEYVNYGLPFIVSNHVSIPKDFDKFGYAYNSDNQLRTLIKERQTKFNFSKEARQSIIDKYSWDSIISTEVMPLLRNEVVR